MQLNSSLLACLFRAVGFREAEFYLTSDPSQQCSSPTLFIHPFIPSFPQLLETGLSVFLFLSGVPFHFLYTFLL